MPGPAPQELSFFGVAAPGLRFGFNRPWQWLMDLDAWQTPAGVLVRSQGYFARQIPGVRCLPFMEVQRSFWGGDEMLHESAQAFHLEMVPATHARGCREYAIAGVKEEDLVMDLKLQRVILQMPGVLVQWQFQPRPVAVNYLPDYGGIGLGFDSSRVEALVTWQREKPLRTRPSASRIKVLDEPVGPTFVSVSESIASMPVVGPGGQRRVLDTRQKHDCLGPGERLVPPAGEILFAAAQGESRAAVDVSPGLWPLAVRRCAGDRVEIGSAAVFSLKRIVQSPSHPMFKPYLVRSLRSLVERRVFSAVPEDDPRERHLWGCGTWARCFTITALDDFGLTREARGYLEFMLDASQQFVEADGLPHLWESFYVTGEHRWDTYDLNGHGMKLYEAGKCYLRHRADDLSRWLREEHYDTLKGWCSWIERHMDADGVLLDRTESSWGFGSGAFSQAPAAAGVELFTKIAADAGRAQDAVHFQGVARRLVQALQTQLFGDAANPFLGIPQGLGQCYVTNIPASGREPVSKYMGLSCYSLAPGHFLADPDVGLLQPDDPRLQATLELAMTHLGCPSDPRIITWHIAHGAHMGYGQGQFLMNLAHSGPAPEFDSRLRAWLESSRQEVGDIYLMQEVHARHGAPNRGNKAHLAYFPVVAALLAGFAPPGAPRRDLVGDIEVLDADGN